MSYDVRLSIKIGGKLARGPLLGNRLGGEQLGFFHLHHLSFLGFISRSFCHFPFHYILLLLLLLLLLLFYFNY